MCFTEWQHYRSIGIYCGSMVNHLNTRQMVYDFCKRYFTHWFMALYLNSPITINSKILFWKTFCMGKRFPWQQLWRSCLQSIPAVQTLQLFDSALCTVFTELQKISAMEILGVNEFILKNDNGILQWLIVFTHSSCWRRKLSFILFYRLHAISSNFMVFAMDILRLAWYVLIFEISLC